MPYIQFFLVAFLVGTLSVVGIISALIAKSHRHWFVRAVLLLVLLSPFLAAGALEVFITLSIVSAVVASGVVFSRTRLSLEVDSRFRFSVASILLMIGLFSVVFAVGVALPEQNVNAWLTILLIGSGGGICVLLGLMVGRKSSRWQLWWFVAVIGSLLVSLPLVRFDWFVRSMMGLYNWPPEEHNFWGLLLASTHNRPVYLWLAICPAVTLLVAIWERLDSGKIGSLDMPAKRVGRDSGMWLARLLLGCLAIFPLTVVWVLLQLATAPEQVSLESNSYGEVLQIAKSIKNSPHADELDDWDIVPLHRLEAAVAGVREPLDSVREKLTLPSSVPVNYFNDELDLEAMSAFRGLARVLMGAGRIEQSHGQADEACRLYLDAIRLGFFIRADGLLIDALVGIACTHEGSSGLYEHLDRFSPSACRRAATEILNALEQTETYEGFQNRDEIWAMNALNWHGRLQNALLRVSGEALLYTKDDLRNHFLLEKARLRLIATELALHAYFREKEHWPTQLEVLIPDYLQEIPVDPYSENRQPLRYVPQGTGYRLYSVGANRIDNGGKASRKGGHFTAQDGLGDGDLLLEVLFRDDEVFEDEDNKVGAPNEVGN